MIDWRLLIDVSPAAGPHGQRGIGRYVRGLVSSMEEWPRDRLEQIWAVGQPGETLRQFGPRAVADGRLSYRPLDAGWLLGRLAAGRALRQAHASAYHSTDPNHPWAPRARTIVTVYDLIPYREPAVLSSWRIDHRRVYRWFLSQVEKADRILAISHATAEDVVRLLHVDRERVHVVYPAVECRQPLPRQPAEAPSFLFLGGLEAHKQPELAVKALAEFRARTGTGHLRFVGPSPEGQQASIVNAAREVGVADRVSFAGRLSDAELDREFATATALVSTSRIEGFGLPPVESILRGLPAIVVDTPAARETIADVGGMLVPPDAKAIADAMEEPREIASEDRERLALRFSRGETARSLWTLYDSLRG